MTINQIHYQGAGEVAQPAQPTEYHQKNVKPKHYVIGSMAQIGRRIIKSLPALKQGASSHHRRPDRRPEVQHHHFRDFTANLKLNWFHSSKKTEQNNPPPNIPEPLPTSPASSLHTSTSSSNTSLSKKISQRLKSNISGENAWSIDEIGRSFEQGLKKTKHQVPRRLEHALTMPEKMSSPPVDSSETPRGQPLGITPLAGMDGYFYFLTEEGELHRYDPTINEVLPSGISHVDQIVMGSNQKVYLISGNHIQELEKEGMLHNTQQMTIELPESQGKLKDLAVAGQGPKKFVLSSEGGLFMKDFSDTDGKLNALRLPLNIALKTPKAVATAADGGVWLVGQNNELFRAQLSNSGELPASSWVSMGKDPESHSIVGLETMPNGSVAVRNASGQLRRPQLNNAENPTSVTWKDVAFDSLTKSAFAAFHRSVLPASKVEVTASAGLLSSTKPMNFRALKHPLETLGNTVKGTRQAYRDFKNFDYSSMQIRSMDVYHSQTRIYQVRLKNLSETRMEPLDNQAKLSLDDRVGEGIRARTNEALDSLEEMLASDKLAIPAKKPSTEGGVLKQIKAIRETVYGPQDEIVQRLSRLLQNDKLNLIDQPPYGGRVAALIADYAILGDAAVQMSSDSNPTDHRVILSEAARLLDESLVHLVARSGIIESDPFGNAAKGFDALQAIFRQQNDVVARLANKYAEAAGTEAIKNPSISQMTELFVNLVNSMKPDDIISLSKGKTVGFSSAVLKMVAHGVVAALSGTTLLSVMVVPVLDFGKVKDLELEIEKAVDGINIRIEKGNSRYKQVGVSASVIPAQDILDLNKKGSIWGAEWAGASLTYKRTNRAADGITLNITDRGDGNMARVIRDILSGNANLFELLKEAEKTEFERITEKRKNLTMGVGIGAGAGVTAPGWSEINGAKGPGFDHAKGGVVDGLGALRTVAKVKALGGVNASATFASRVKVEKSSFTDGSRQLETRTQKFGLDSVAVGGGIQNVVESALAKIPTPGDMRPGEGESNMAVNLRGSALGVIPSLDLSRTFPGLGKNLERVLITHSPDGLVKEVKTKMMVNNPKRLFASVDPDNTLINNVPGLKEALNVVKTSMKNSNKKAETTTLVMIKLKPELLESLPEKKDEQEARMKELASDPANFRITNVLEYAFNTQNRSKGMSIFFTRKVDGSLMTMDNPAHIQLLYGQAAVSSKAHELLERLSRFGDGAWGTEARKTRLSGLSKRLENLVNAMAHEPSSTFKSGASLEKDFKRDMSVLTTGFFQKIHNIMADTVSLGSRHQIHHEFNALSEAMSEVRKRHHVEPFNGIAIDTMGRDFERVVDGQLQEAFAVGRSDEVSMDRIYPAIKRIAEIDLSLLSSKKRTAALKKIRQDMDIVKRDINAITNIDSDKKQVFLAELESMAVRKTDYYDGKRILQRLDELMNNH